ncbi:MAG: protease modulator HflC [Kiritimatiellia bacterium]
MTNGGKSTGGIVAAVIVVLAAIVVFASTYKLDEAEQAVILQFGASVGDPVTEPGLHFKKPFIQEVRLFEKRLLTWDGDPNQVPTLGREFISVDTTARWRISDPLLFLKSVKNETGAQSRLDDIIDSVVRDKVSSTEVTEIVRSKGWQADIEDMEEVGQVETERREALTKEVQMGRGQLVDSILEEARKIMPSFGIELRDVRIKRINYIPSVQRQVFNRMISERKRIAERYRSEGHGQSAEISGRMQEELTDITSEAKRKAEVIRGRADADATRIYNEAYNRDPEFYAFYRSLESYVDSLAEKTTLFLGTDSDYLRYLTELRRENR